MDFAAQHSVLPLSSTTSLSVHEMPTYAKGMLVEQARCEDHRLIHISHRSALFPSPFRMVGILVINNCFRAPGDTQFGTGAHIVCLCRISMFLFTEPAG